MAVFSYKALAVGGAVSTGELTAADRGEALRQLDRKGLQPISLSAKAEAPVKAVKSKAAGKKEGKAPPKVKSAAKSEATPSDGPLKLKRAEVVMFTEELSDMLAAGLQLEPALRSMENRQELGN
ncbi:MAG: type II secretion system F family protein, partial [Verrucomicrobiales bacterium]